MSKENFEMQFPFVNPPGWAPKFCYVYYILAILNFVFALFAAYMLYDRLPILAFIVLLGFIIFGFIELMIYFWICQSALKNE
jgi:hypothetical protein